MSTENINEISSATVSSSVATNGAASSHSDSIEPANEPHYVKSTEISSSQVSNWGFGIGALLVVLGIAALVLPTVTALAVAIWLGIMFLVAGVGLLIQAFQSRRYGSIAFEIIGGIIYTAGGLVMLIVPMSGVLTLALVLGVVFILDGIARIVFASRVQFPAGKFCWILDGVMAILLGGLILWNWPGAAAWIIGVLVGIRLLISGIVTLTVSNWIRKIAAAQQ